MGFKVDAFKTCRRKNGPIPVAVFQLLQACIYVSAKIYNFMVWVLMQPLGLASKTSCGNYAFLVEEVGAFMN